MHLTQMHQDPVSICDSNSCLLPFLYSTLAREHRDMSRRILSTIRDATVDTVLIITHQTKQCALPTFSSLQLRQSFIYIFRGQMSIDGLLTIRSSQAIAHKNSSHNPPILDVRTAYQEWFNDLYKSTPPKLPAISRRKKSFESAEIDEILKLRKQPRKKRFSKKYATLLSHDSFLNV